MKWHTIGILALQHPVTEMDILGAHGFKLTKKVFMNGGPAAKTFYQAETDAEDRELRMKGFESFHLAQQKEAHGGRYR